MRKGAVGWILEPPSIFAPVTDSIFVSLDNNKKKKKLKTTMYIKWWWGYLYPGDSPAREEATDSYRVQEEWQQEIGLSSLVLDHCYVSRCSVIIVSDSTGTLYFLLVCLLWLAFIMAAIIVFVLLTIANRMWQATMSTVLFQKQCTSN